MTTACFCFVIISLALLRVALSRRHSSSFPFCIHIPLQRGIVQLGNGRLCNLSELGHTCFKSIIRLSGGCYKCTTYCVLMAFS
eukprot:6186354-Pleurochrysis_carterae.AAC.1